MKSLEATVVKHTGSHYLLSELPQWNLFPAVLAGKVRLKKSAATNPVAVGDRVLCDVPEGVCEENPAVITAIRPRSNYVIRKSTNLSREAHIIAANLDKAFIIVTLAFPEVKLPFLDRILLTCEVYGVQPVIVLNKIDLLRRLEAESGGNMSGWFKKIYVGAGYSVIETSAVTGEGVDELRRMLGKGVNLLSGISGVGKSSIVKALDPGLNPRTAEISLSHLQGRHTTTFYEMYPLSSGGYVIDTPGIRSFGLLELEKEEIALYFPEMRALAPECRFAPCTHTHEPECAVKAAVDSGAISPERYASYLGMLEEQTKYR